MLPVKYFFIKIYTGDKIEPGNILSMMPMRRLRAACVSAHSDPSLRCAPEGILDSSLLTASTANTLIRLCGSEGLNQTVLS